jgi:hypothetical protein
MTGLPKLVQHKLSLQYPRQLIIKQLDFIIDTSSQVTPQFNKLYSWSGHSMMTLSAGRQSKIAEV